MEFLQKLTRTRSKDIYFCLPQESLSHGIHTPVNDGDYKEFLDLAYANERRMNVYVDHYNEPIFEWIKEEENEDQDYSCEEDEDSILSDTYSVDHEEDNAEYPFPANKTMGDRSKDDDLGKHNVTSNGYYHWSFCDRLDSTTTFDAEFWWGQSYDCLEAFAKLARRTCDRFGGIGFRVVYCYWQLRSDGFYISPVNVSFPNPSWAFSKPWGSGGTLCSTHIVSNKA
ncbi:unnamed protein product [Lactuca virosa]|uniref:S-protein homolog n=1 Tax=Lactuca virosa TaxID=75947 RepID=A0AAU9LEY4_9ASTR|nr:unnamed protein product [Lactuca virosa]